MSTPNLLVTTVHAEVRSIALSGRVVRVALLGDELVLTVGYNSDDPTAALVGGCRIPAAVWPALARAAAELLEGL
jgi:hypothetical protein